jgi:hypothetical protein
MNIWQTEKMITHIIATMVDDDGCLTDQGEAELDKLYATREDQVDDLLRERVNVLADIAGIDSAIDALTMRRNAHTDTVKRIDSALERCLQGSPYKCQAGVVSWRKSEIIVIDEESAVPEEWQKRKTTISIDKAGLKAAIKKGLVVDYAHVETKNNMSIK